MSSDQSKATAPTGIAAIVARIQALKPVRVFTHYGEHRGALLAGGLSYQAIFAVFAAVWVAFSVIGLFLQSNDVLRNSLFDIISTSVPGLIDRGSGGAIDPTDLFETGVLGWTGAIALAGLLLTALGWLASGRDAVRTIFGIDRVEIELGAVEVSQTDLVGCPCQRHRLPDYQLAATTRCLGQDGGTEKRHAG